MKCCSKSVDKQRPVFAKGNYTWQLYREPESKINPNIMQKTLILELKEGLCMNDNMRIIRKDKSEDSSPIENQKMLIKCVHLKPLLPASVAMKVAS